MPYRSVSWSELEFDMMRKNIMAIYAIVLLAAVLVPAMRSAAATITQARILHQIERCANAEISKIKEPAPTGWVHGVLYTGLVELYRASGNNRYLEPVLKAGDHVKWHLDFGPRKLNLAQAGNSFSFGQAITGIYAINHKDVRIQPLKSCADQMLAYFKANASNPRKLAWWWCDSLFMAPPAFAHLSVLTHNPKYRNAMNQQWWAVTHLLYDKKEHLFFRDQSFFKTKSPNGQPVFWSRGNGWVIAGTAHTLKYLPETFPDRPRYVQLLRQMATKLASLQGPDGLWRTNLLDYNQFPMPESSGTALDCYGMAWGIHHHLLSKKKFMPVVAKAWAGLLAMRNKAGDIAHVQSPGDQPEAVTPDVTEPYASGAFIMAGAQLMKLAPFNLPAVTKAANSK